MYINEYTLLSIIDNQVICTYIVCTSIRCIADFLLGYCKREPSNLAFSFLLKFISVKATVQNYKEMQNPCFSHIPFKSKSFPFPRKPYQHQAKEKERVRCYHQNDSALPIACVSSRYSSDGTECRFSFPSERNVVVVWIRTKLCRVRIFLSRLPLV